MGQSSYFKRGISEHMLQIIQIKFIKTSCEIALRRRLQNTVTIASGNGLVLSGNKSSIASDNDLSYVFNSWWP